LAHTNEIMQTEKCVWHWGVTDKSTWSMWTCELFVQIFRSTRLYHFCCCWIHELSRIFL